MPRKSAFDEWEKRSPKDGSDPSLPAQPPSPIDLIPAAEPRQRNRGWDNEHRAWSYKIPEHLRQKAADIRDAINGIAQAGSTTTDEVAKAFVCLALLHLERGKFKIVGRPDPRRQKMSVVWEESESKWPQEIPAKKTRSKKPVPAKKSMFLAYRWSKAVHQKIIHASSQTIAMGDVLVALLEHGLESYRRGKLKLDFQPRNMASGEWL